MLAFRASVRAVRDRGSLGESLDRERRASVEEFGANLPASFLHERVEGPDAHEEAEQPRCERHAGPGLRGGSEEPGDRFGEGRGKTEDEFHECGDGFEHTDEKSKGRAGR